MKKPRERNRLLQDNGGAQNGWLDGLEEAMALNGVAIAAARLTALDALAGGLAAIPKRRFRAPIALLGTLEASLRTQSALEAEDQFRRQLAAARALDAAAGRCLDGPHRAIYNCIMRPKTCLLPIARRANKKPFWLGFGASALRGGATRRRADFAAR